MSYRDFTQALLVAAYLASQELEHLGVSSGDLLDNYELRGRTGWMAAAVEEMADQGYVEHDPTLGGDRGLTIILKGRGIREAELLMANGIEVARVGGISPPGSAAFIIPAADREVRLGDNEFKEEVEPSFTELILRVDQSNGDPDDPSFRRRILGQLKAGLELLRAGEFKAYILEVTLVSALDELIKRYADGVVVGLATSLLQYILTNGLSGQ